MMRFPTISAALAGILLPAQPLLAQDSDGYRVRAGVGAQVRPEFVGADGREWAPYWGLSIAREGEEFDFAAPDQSFGVSLLGERAFSAGPVFNIKGSRKSSEVGFPVGKVPTTIEAGGFVQYELGPSWRLRGELRKGIGGHDGIIGSIGADHVWRDGDRYVFSLGPRLLFSNARYQRAYFGVSPEAAALSPLAEYRPGGGIHAVAATSGMHYQLSGRWGLFGFARYERLVGDAADSPIVTELGSRNQMSAGLGISHTFSIDP